VSQWDLEVLAASLRRDSDDLSMYAGFLLSTLSGALPAHLVRVERAGGLLTRMRRGDPPVVAVSVLLGDRRFTLRREALGAPASAQIGHESGGVVLRTESVSVEVWSRELAAALARYAQANAAAAQALSQLTMPGSP
jgi:hypothetical protein